MTTALKYIGTLIAGAVYSELPVTGKQRTWSAGQIQDCSDADAALLRATGLFSAALNNSLTPQQLAAVSSSLVNDQKRLKIVGNNYCFGQITAAGGTDIGGTMGKTYYAASALSKVAALYCTHGFANGGAGATEDHAAAPRNFAQCKFGVEYPLGSKTSQATLNGRQIWTVDPVSPLVQCDPVGVAIPAGGQFRSRFYVKPALAPSGAGSAAAIAGGSLAAQAWFYVVTRTEAGIESGPQTEITATTATSNLAVAITITDTRSASADYYTIYRSATTGATKQYLGRTAGPTKRFVDDGSLSVDTTINPPAASNYRFNTLTVGANESTSHVNAGGVGDDQVAAVGTFGITNGAFKYGVSPTVIVGDDTSGKSILMLGDSIPRGSGFNLTTGTYLQDLNFFNLAVANAGSAGSYNCANAAYQGSTLSEMVAATQAGGGRSRLLLINYADWVIDEHGTNDLALVADWTILAANKLLLGRLCHARGAKFATTTILPRVTSTDNCLTIANQTKVAGAGTTRRDSFNSWCRNGFQVDASGAPVVSGGTPSPDIDSYVEICSNVEVDATNTFALGGGYWRVPTAPAVSGIAVTSTGGTAAAAPVLNFAASAAGAAYSKISRAIKMTSGAQNGQTAVVANQTGTTALQVYGTGETTQQSGVAVATLSALPANGDTFDIYDVLTNEGLHPAIPGHVAIAASLTAWIQANITG